MLSSRLQELRGYSESAQDGTTHQQGIVKDVFYCMGELPDNLRLLHLCPLLQNSSLRTTVKNYMELEPVTPTLSIQVLSQLKFHNTVKEMHV